MINPTDSLAASLGVRYAWVVEHKPDASGIQAPYAWEARLHTPEGTTVVLKGRANTVESADFNADLTIRDHLQQRAYENRRAQTLRMERDLRVMRRTMR